MNLRFPHAGYREKIWDHAAGALIVTEAGAVISDAAGALQLEVHGMCLMSVGPKLSKSVRPPGCAGSPSPRSPAKLAN